VGWGVSAHAPEDVVEEETDEQCCSDLKAAEIQKLDSVDRKRQAEEVAGEPVLGEEVDDADGGGDADARQVDVVE
jgi:hypothetical protein